MNYSARWLRRYSGLRDISIANYWSLSLLTFCSVGQVFAVADPAMDFFGKEQGHERIGELLVYLSRECT